MGRDQVIELKAGEHQGRDDRRPKGEKQPEGARRGDGERCDDAEDFVVGPDGERMTRADLPDANTRRWVPRRKARVVAAVEGGLVSREWALERYRLSAEEFDSWKAAMSRFGMRGLCVTKLGRRRGAAG